jgi:hypothetical protein
MSLKKQDTNLDKPEQLTNDGKSYIEPVFTNIALQGLPRIEEEKNENTDSITKSQTLEGGFSMQNPAQYADVPKMKKGATSEPLPPASPAKKKSQ